MASTAPPTTAGAAAGDASATPVASTAPGATPGAPDSGGAAAGKEGTPFASDKKEAGEILRQADLLQQQNAQLAAELAYFRAEKAKQEQEYGKEREPQLKQYVEYLERKSGKPMDAEEKRINERVFSKPEYKKEADRRWQEFQDNISVAASLKQREEELAVLRAERDQLREAQNKLSATLGPSATRASYAQALSVPDMSSAVNASAQGYLTKEASVNASGGVGGLALNEIMGVAPSATEKAFGFLQEYNFPVEMGVRASGGGGKQLRMSMPVAPEHSLLLDPITGERQFPASMRYHSPHLFSRYVNDRSYLDGDSVHASVVVRNTEGTFEQVVNDVRDIK